MSPERKRHAPSWMGFGEEYELPKASQVRRPPQRPPPTLSPMPHLNHLCPLPAAPQAAPGAVPQALLSKKDVPMWSMEEDLFIMDQVRA